MVVKLDTACISLYSKILPLLVQSSILQTKIIWFLCWTISFRSTSLIILILWHFSSLWSWMLLLLVWLSWILLGYSYGATYHFQKYLYSCNEVNGKFWFCFFSRGIQVSVMSKTEYIREISDLLWHITFSLHLSSLFSKLLTTNSTFHHLSNPWSTFITYAIVRWSWQMHCLTVVPLLWLYRSLLIV